MSEQDYTQVLCKSCEAPVKLASSAGDLYLRCDCPKRGIDVSDAVSGNTLFDPFSGHWSTLDD